MLFCRTKLLPCPNFSIGNKEGDEERQGPGQKDDQESGQGIVDPVIFPERKKDNLISLTNHGNPKTKP
jgi:hypothetical protein